ncbi:MAG TPA: 3-dehydroquinate synthase [Hyphomonadaceae bacterium]|nr:3-dehydroquinate synthase [Hyphomonadaceae bacterium]
MTKAEGPTTIRVGLGARGYDVVIGPHLLEEAGARIACLGARRKVMVIADANAHLRHGARLAAGLAAAGLATRTLVVAPGEAQKSFAGLEAVLDAMLAAQLDRGDLTLAFGGGVIGDLVGLAAGLYKRGIGFVQIPTTLLAQVDSSVGGKTAINTRHGKNLVGLFHQPLLVLADLTCLASLPPREMRAGYAEVVKYALLGDRAFFDWLETHGAAALAGEIEALSQAVAVSVGAKAGIVARDETETGERMLLNLGHTFGHALEAACGYDGRLLHGEAVATGMAFAFDFSARMGYCAQEDRRRVRAHLDRMGFATRLGAVAGGPYDPDDLVARMDHDKKTRDGALTLILARRIGEAFVARGAPRAEIVETLRQAL